MSYILTLTLDRSMKGLYNRSKVILKKINFITRDDNVEILSINIETTDGLNYEIGPIWDSKMCLKRFPIKLQFIENTFQIQGENFKNQIIYVDFKDLCYIDRYVTITRVQNTNQLKILYNDYDLL